MSDRILLDRIAVFARHGVMPEEATTGQRFFISIEAQLDLRHAARADDLTLGLDYGALAGLAARIATERRFNLIEALAEAIAADALSAFPRLAAITVRIDKPAAPIPLVLAGVAVEITRARDG